MMQLSLKPAVFGRENKIPIATCAAVVAPVRNRRIVTENRVEGYFCFVLVSEVFRPRIDFFLACRVPWHLAAERVSFISPMIGAGSHFGFEVAGLLLHAFPLEVAQNLKKDVSFHLPEDCQVRREIIHGYGGLICILDIPFPSMVRNQALMVACQPIEHPIRSRNVRIIIGAVYLFLRFFVPTRPRRPIEIAAVVTVWHFVRLVIEQALAHSVLMRTVFVLQSTPEDTVDELLQLLQFFPIRLNQFLHHSCEPCSSSALVSETGNPGPAVLHHNLVGFAIIGHDRRTTVKRILWVYIPLLGGQEMTQVRYSLRLGLDNEILKRLYGAIIIAPR